MFKIKLMLMALLLLSAQGLATADETYDPNHTAYDEVLKEFVKDGLVDYPGLKKNPKQLNQYLDYLSGIKQQEFKSWDENDQLAYLINFYNAATLKLIVDHYPVKSIKDIGGLLSGPWRQKVVNLFGDTINLSTLEHEIIRKNYDEPRIHIALVCAAKGCPPLRNEAYTGEKLDRQLDNQSDVFLAGPTGLRIDRPNNAVYLSSILKWYGKDFIRKYTPESGFAGFDKTEQAVLHFTSRYVSEDDRKYLESGNYSIDYLDYDWSLNERQVDK